MNYANIKNFLERKTFLGMLARHRKYSRYKRKYKAWKENGAVLPMPHFGKYLTLKAYVDRCSPQMFIETGTYKGDMTYAMLRHIPKLVTIELSQKFFNVANKRFAGYKQVKVLNGQSGLLISEVLRDVETPCLLWLDAHCSGGNTAKGDLDTPIVQELNCVLQHPKSEEFIILIDDAREFVGSNDYPTIKFVEDMVESIRPDWHFGVTDDIIRIYSSRFQQ